MIEFNKEYFKKPFYFFLKDNGDKISVYYSVSNTLNEAKETDNVVEIPKKNEGKLKSFIGKIVGKGSVPSLEYITKKLKSYKETALDELKEIKALGEQLNEELCPAGKAYIKRRQAAGEKSSAYLSGRGVKVCKGQMSGRKKKK